MCFATKTPTPAPLPAQPTTPEKADYIKAAKARDKSKIAAAVGRQNTILTTPFGAPETPNLKQKTLLGS